MIMSAGYVFWILVALGVVALITFFERLLDLHRAQVDYQDFLKGVVNVLDAGNAEEALSICDELNAPVAQVVATAIRHRDGAARVLREAVDSQGRAEVGRLDRRLATLAIIGQIAPLIGLFGTVVGFVRTVMTVNSAELVVRSELLNGAMQALLTAAAGIFLAILATVMYGSLRVRLERIIVDLEAAASQIIGYISTQKERKK